MKHDKITDDDQKPAADQNYFCTHLETLSFSGSQPSKRHNKVLVTGLGRSGTSAISSLLHHSGYWMGESDEINPNLNENLHLQKLLNKHKYDEIHTILNEWEKCHHRIAWKEPKLFLGKHREFFNQFSDDWLIIVLFRDPMATSQRRISIEGNTLIDMLDHVIMNQKILCKFLTECKNPNLIISFEKFIRAPEKAIGEIRNFLAATEDTNISDRSLWHLMLNDQKAYQEYARSQKSEFEGTP